MRHGASNAGGTRGDPGAKSEKVNILIKCDEYKDDDCYKDGRQHLPRSDVPQSYDTASGSDVCRRRGLSE